MAQSGATFVPDINRLLSPLLQGLQQQRGNELSQRKLALLEEIQRGNLDVNQREIALKELQRTDDVDAQQNIQGVLSQQFGGQPQQGDVTPTGGQNIVPGDLALTPGGDIGVSGGGIAPVTQSVLDTEKSLASSLIGIKGGLQVFNSLQPILKRGRADELLAAKQEIEETQRFALKLDRAKTRADKNRIIDQRQSQLIQDTGRIDPDLQAMRNMSDNELEGEILTDLAQGDSLTKLVDNRLVPPKPAKPLDKFEDVLGPDGKVIAQKNITTGEIKKSPLATGGQPEKATFAKSPGVVVELPDGTFAQSIPVIDTRTGKIVNKIVPLQGQPVSRLGETGEALTARKIREAGGKALTKTQVTRLATDINDGISAAKGMAVVNRSIKLLDDLTTGGFDAIKLRIKQVLGTESANEAELVANMGKQVLAQLRPIFGSQFTEREGATLTRIEAGFGKSTKGNIRLLNQMKQLIQRAAKRGIAAAVDTKDFRTAQDIQDLMEFELLEEAPETEEALGTGESGAEDLSKLSIEELLNR